MKCRYDDDKTVEIGVDEAGRGPGLGRVYTAAVIWPDNVDNPLIRDSKLIKNKDKMKRAYNFILANAVNYSIDYATEREIEDGIQNANMKSMHRAIGNLITKDDARYHLLIDGNYFDLKSASFEITENIKISTIVKGDSLYYSIAAASILAKYSRDQYVLNLCRDYPDLQKRYSIEKNKGYLTSDHMSGLKEHGYTQFHRKTWKTFTDMPYSPVSKKIKIKPVIKPRILNH